MPSSSYDFFAPLGEFGQIRPHYHKMRRLHLLLEAHGSDVASTATHPLQGNANGIRAAVRAADYGKPGFIFVNNYERLVESMPTFNDTRFRLEWTEKNISMTIPSLHLPSFNVPRGSWWVWPYHLPIGKGRLQWATAQLLTKATRENRSAWIFSAIKGIPPTMEFMLGEGAYLLHCKCNANTTKGITTMSDIQVGTDPVASILLPSGVAVDIVVLSPEDADSVWNARNVAALARGADFFAISSNGSFQIQPKSNVTSVEVFTWPGTLSAAPAHLTIPVRSDSLSISPPTVTKIRAARLPTRTIPIAPTKKAQEPTMQEWIDYAAAFNVTLHLPADVSNIMVQLSVDYTGDAARLLYGDRLLTDNWYSGYEPLVGGFEVGLSYLADENDPGLLQDGTNLTLLVLPLNRSALEDNVFLQSKYWPAFSNNGTAIEVRSIVTTATKMIYFDHMF